MTSLADLVALESILEKRANSIPYSDYYLLLKDNLTKVRKEIKEREKAILAELK